MISALEPLWPTAFLAVGLVVPVTATLVFFYFQFFYVDTPVIEGIPEIPGAELIAGHVYQIGDDHATTLEQWSLKYKWPVFQIRMGQRRAVVLNSFESAREWMVKNQSATSDRPWFYTFHGVVSATSGQSKVNFSLLGLANIHGSVSGDYWDKSME